MHYSFISISLVNNSKTQGMVLSAEPNITRPNLEYIIIHYHKMQQLITYNIALYKQQINPTEAGESNQNSPVQLFTLLSIN